MHTTSRKQLLTLANAAADQRHKDIVDYKAECCELQKRVVDLINELTENTREIAILKEQNQHYLKTITELKRALEYAE